MLQAYLLYFDTSITKFQAEIIHLNNVTSEALDNNINKILQSNSFDFYNYSDEFAILVDDYGFEKPYSPVFQITNAYGGTAHLAGRLLFVRNIENEFSTDIGSIEYEDILYLKNNLAIKFIGLTTTR